MGFSPSSSSPTVLNSGRPATRELDRTDMSPAEEEWRQLMEYFAHDDCGRLVVLITTGIYV